MTKFLKILIIILLLAVIGVGIWWWLQKKQTTNLPALNSDGSEATSTPQVGLEDIGNLKTDDTDRALIQLSLGWAERFASYSNHDNYQNFVELNSVMTQNAKEQNKILVDGFKKEHKLNDPYWGITSQALTATIESGGVASSQAKIVVKLQRHEVGQNLDKNYQQDLIFEIIKSGSIWQIQSAEFGKL